MSYAAVIWTPATLFSSTMEPMVRIHRTMLLMTCGVMKPTPTAGLECILGILPIGYHILQLALLTQYRLKKRDQWRDGTERNLRWSSHTDVCNNSSKGVPEMEYPCYNSLDSLPVNMHFTIEIRSRRDWLENGYPHLTPNSWGCHTDGLTTDGASGAAYLVARPCGRIDSMKILLGSFQTAFETELIALLRALVGLPDCGPGSEINFFVDCESV